MRSSIKGQVIHSSLKEMTSVKSDFPNSNPTPGVLARAVFHRANDRTMVEIYHESPVIVSPGKGEFVEADIDIVDSRVRELLIEISERCRLQGEELLAYSERLMNIVSEDKIIDDIIEQSPDNHSGKANSTMIDISYIEYKRKQTKSKDKVAKSKSNKDELLDMLEETSLESDNTDDEDDNHESNLEDWIESEKEDIDKDDLLDMLEDL
jgi:hypothetical protein